MSDSDTNWWVVVVGFEAINGSYAKGNKNQENRLVLEAKKDGHSMLRLESFHVASSVRN